MYVCNKYYCYKKINSQNYDINSNENNNDNNNYTINSNSGNSANNEKEMYNNHNKDYYFEAPVFLLSNTTNSQIYEIFDNFYLVEDEIQFQLNIYGENKLVIESINFLIILGEKLFSFVTIYTLFVSIFWFYEKYYYCYIIFGLSFILLFFTTYQKYRNKKKVLDFSINKLEKINVYDGAKKSLKLINHEDLVPGQIIVLKENDVLPCDCLLLNGFCSCIESSLTGESASIMKYKLPKNSCNFKYSENQKSFLFCGTKIENCYPNELKALVIGTGFNTQRGNLIQSVLFPKKSNYNFYKENITYFIFIFIFFFIGIIIISILTAINDEDYSISVLFRAILDLLTIAIPPTLPLSLTIGSFYYHYSLLNKNVSCSGIYRLMASGKINKLIFDKTGTLTEEDVELYGYVSSIKKDGCLILDSKESNSKLYLSHLFQYYKNVYHNQLINNTKEFNKDDTDNTITYFMECLATCHSVTKINDQNKGNSIDIRIFNDVNWIYDSINVKAKVNDQFEVKPKKYFKITEEKYFVNNYIFNKLNGIDNFSNEDDQNAYKLKVIYRSHFESRNQSMSVIVKNNFNETIRLFIKGAPEKIIVQCMKRSIPVNYDEIYRKYTLQGFRVLACATKLIAENSKDELDIICNEEYQNYKGNDLIFLGLILFQNKIKENTKNVLQKLKGEGLFPIISTGDNAFTSISLVKECKLVENYSKFCILDIIMDNDDLSNKKLKKEYFNERPKNIPQQRENIILNCIFEKVNYTQPSKNNSSIFSVILRKNNLKNENELFNKKYRTNKKHELIKIEELNNKLLEEQDMKLCIHSHVFDFIFFRNKEGNEDDSLEEKLKENKKEKSQENNIDEDEETQLNLLRQIIVDKGILFFRMNPNDKTKLVQLFKKQDPNNIIAMCGDGANDCSALISADVGISLKSRENIIMTSHLMAKTKSITIINDILNIGKTCYENSTSILKILLIYSEIKTASRCLMKSKDDNMTKNQYFYLDCIIVLFGCCLMSTSNPNYKKKRQKCSNNSKFTNNYYLISVLGHTFFQIGLLIIYFFCIINKHDYYEKDTNNDYLYSQDITSVNSYIFFLNSFQSLSLIFVCNFFSVYKDSIFKNRLFNFYLIIIILILSELMSLDNYHLGIINYDLVHFIDVDIGGGNSQTSRLHLLLFCILSFIAMFLWEMLLYLINSNKCSIFTESKETENKKEVKNEIKIKKLLTYFGERRSNTFDL
jgi:cation-transporting ATPase 13A3/4/5